MPKPTKITRRISLPALHKRLDSVFSQFIRLRDCVKTTGTVENGACITCGNIHPYSSLQAGHFISRAHYAIRYDERNVNAQCVGCNMFKHGAVEEYFIRLEEMHGRPVVDELLSLKHQTRRFQRSELEGMIGDYKTKLEELRE